MWTGVRFFWDNWVILIFSQWGWKLLAKLQSIHVFIPDFLVSVWFTWMYKTGSLEWWRSNKNSPLTIYHSSLNMYLQKMEISLIFSAPHPKVFKTLSYQGRIYTSYVLPRNKRGNIYICPPIKNIWESPVVCNSLNKLSR